MITIIAFCSTKESKNSLLNSFDHDMLNGASSIFALKILLQISLFFLLIIYKIFKNLIYRPLLFRLCYSSHRGAGVLWGHVIIRVQGLPPLPGILTSVNESYSRKTHVFIFAVATQVFVSVSFQLNSSV